MQFTEKQSGVLKGVGFGLLMAIAIIVMGVWFNPFSFSENLNEMERLSIALQCSLIPTFFLAISIGRLAKHRFLPLKILMVAVYPMEAMRQGYYNLCYKIH